MNQKFNFEKKKMSSKNQTKHSTSLLLKHNLQLTKIWLFSTI